MSTDEYVPSEALLRTAWSDYCQRMDACNAWVRPDEVDPRAEFDRFLARVRRDAKAEVLRETADWWAANPDDDAFETDGDTRNWLRDVATEYETGD